MNILPPFVKFHFSLNETRKSLISANFQTLIDIYIYIYSSHRWCLPLPFDSCTKENVYREPIFPPFFSPSFFSLPIFSLFSSKSLWIESTRIVRFRRPSWNWLVAEVEISPRLESMVSLFGRFCTCENRCEKRFRLGKRILHNRTIAGMNQFWRNKRTISRFSDCW